ncbi:MAG TPA: AAC(3) family N-acetyltransferase [Clostridiaceae bacterium]
MSEEKAIDAVKEMNTITSVYKGLQELGVKNGDTLLVHSSLSSLGWVCGGAQGVVMALLKAVGEKGTLVMPTHSGDISDPSEWRYPPVPKEWVDEIYEMMPAFDINLSPSRGMGKSAELFRNLPKTIRSNHPQVSFCASGNVAEEITREHELTPSFGMNTPIGRMYELGGKVLLLGVGYDSCSSFHLSEVLSENMPSKRMGAAIIENKKRTWKWFEDYAYDSDKDFEELGMAFEDTGMVRTGYIGNASCKIFSLKEGVDFATTWLKKNRFHLDA